MEAALRAAGLEQYVAQAEVCRAAVRMESAAAEFLLVAGAGMKQGHVHKFMRAVWTRHASARDGPVEVS